ncbi:MAG: Na+/H+ antiporter, partial [Nitrospira sp.]|nr:Na+/H+ antiporter [Nitrospira sp.]
FTVILVTLVLQGLSLPPLIRWLRLEEDQGLEQEEMLARGHAATAALNRLDQVVAESWATAEQVERVRLRYSRRLKRFAQTSIVERTATVGTTEAFQRLQYETLTAERMALIILRDNGTISDDILHHLEQELDVAALHLGVGERRAGRSQA